MLEYHVANLGVRQQEQDMGLWHDIICAGASATRAGG
jgi:hypothetical protein